jgi:hypothetical protein
MIRLHDKSELDLKMLKSNLKSGYVRVPKGATEIWQWLSDNYWMSIGSPSFAEHSGMEITGNLINSVRVHMINESTFEVIVDNEYAVRLEYGDLNTNLPPRPYAEPAVFFFEETEVVGNLVEQHLKDVFV